MNKQLVPLEVAILLKEAGFDWPTISYYFLDKNVAQQFTRNIDHNKESQYTSAPDLPTVTQWLREMHNLHIALIPSSELAYWKVRVYSSDGYENTTGAFDSHDAALSAGIQYSLTLLKEKK